MHWQIGDKLVISCRFYDGQDHCLICKPSSSINLNGLEYCTVLTQKIGWGRPIYEYEATYEAIFKVCIILGM